MTSGGFKITFLIVAILIFSVAIVILTITSPENLKTATGVVEENRSTLSISGIGLITVKPDQVSVRLTLETEAKTASEALSKNTELMNKVIEAVKQLGLEDRELKTTALSIYPQYFYPKDEPPILTGYMAVNTITVTTKKLEIVGLLIDTAVANGINRIDGVWFSVSNELMNSTKLTLISLAVEDAKRKAEAALKPLDMSV
ncbi:SIMPL domain-containing protein, partial [Candidatus Bathyarchaeota archaeon]|nr:SIMPL domain-containing protein [Candidatus Bathyarchaeota archaeon]